MDHQEVSARTESRPSGRRGRAGRSSVTGVDARLLDVAHPQSILSRPVVTLLITSLGSCGSFYLLLPVVPLYTAAAGAGSVGAGLSTGAMMLATVLVEFAVPGLLSRYGYRAAMTLGLILLGAPAVVLAASSSLPLVMGVCMLRGAGLGIVSVAGSAAIAELVPAERRGEGLGLYGLAVTVPSIVCLPLGLWLNARIGYWPVFLAGAALSLLVLAAVHGLPARSARVESARVEHHGSVLGALRVGGLAGQALIFAAVTLAAGVLLTFLPLALSAESYQLGAVALLVQSCAAPLARWGAGWYGDRHGSARLLVPAVLATALGAAGLVWLDNPLAVVAGMGLFGIGFGMAQNVTLALMFERVPASDFGRVSALWNLAYDGGLGIGAAGFGLLAGPVGYPAGFALTAGVLFAALAPAWRGATAGTKTAAHLA